VLLAMSSHIAERHSVPVAAIDVGGGRRASRAANLYEVGIDNFNFPSSNRLLPTAFRADPRTTEEVMALGTLRQRRLLALRVFVPSPVRRCRLTGIEPPAEGIFGSTESAHVVRMVEDHAVAAIGLRAHPAADHLQMQHNRFRRTREYDAAHGRNVVAIGRDADVDEHLEAPTFELLSKLRARRLVHPRVDH